MSGPDGLEERTHDLEDRQSRIPDHDTRANAADAERDALWSTPTRCVVFDHDFHPTKHYCRRCGLSAEMAMAIVGGVA